MEAVLAEKQLILRLSVISVQVQTRPGVYCRELQRLRGGFGSAPTLLSSSMEDFCKERSRRARKQVIGQSTSKITSE